MASIEAHNKNPNATYRQGVNDASAYTDEQKLKRNGYVAPKMTVTSSEYKRRVKGALPNTWDYTRYGSQYKFWEAFSLSVSSKMSPVKNQGLCGW